MKRKLFFSSLIIISILFSSSCGKKEAGRDEAEIGEENEQGVITLSDEALQIAKIKLEAVRFITLFHKIIAPGIISFNERTFAHITSRVPGRVEELFAFPGDKVQERQLLLNLYSPEFLSAQAEFLQAETRLRNAIRDNHPETQATAKSIFESAKQKLLLLGLAGTELEELQETRRIRYLLPLRAPFSGSIVESNAIVGSYIETGFNLFKIANLTTLWVRVNIYEKDLSKIAEGCQALIKVAAFPDLKFNGRLTLLSDIVDEKTRTLQGRVEVSNRAGKLRPGMFADITLISPYAHQILAVPEEAIQRLEGREIVFIPLENNSFLPIEVKTGKKMNGLTEVVEGIKDGDKVVTQGSFILKSELLKKSFEGE